MSTQIYAGLQSIDDMKSGSEQHIMKVFNGDLFLIIVGQSEGGLIEHIDFDCEF